MFILSEIEIKRIVQNEDCLNLNIWAPNKVLETDEKLPVLFYIHGGAFFGGNNQKEEEEGSFVAQEQDIIVVKVLFQNPLY